MNTKLIMGIAAAVIVIAGAFFLTKGSSEDISAVQDINTLAGDISENTAEAIDNAADAIEETADNAAEAIEDTYEDAVEFADEAINGSENTADDVAADVEEAVDEVKSEADEIVESSSGANVKTEAQETQGGFSEAIEEVTKPVESDIEYENETKTE